VPGLQINGNVEGGKSAQLTLTQVRDLPACNRTGQLEFAATFSAPFDSDEGRGDLINDRGIPGGLAAELSVTASISPPRDLSANDGFLDTKYLILQATAGFEIDDFKYRDPITFASAEERRTGFGFSGSIGRMPNGTTFYAAGFRYERRYEAPDARILCQTPSAVPIECVQAAFGPPEREVDATLFGLFRRLSPLGENIPLAFELRASYDFAGDVAAIQLPLYVFLDSNSRYRAGVIAGWDSESDDVSVGLFVGIPFDLFRIGS
jgi:hypothetical protein